MTDNRTNEPTEEQVEAAAKAYPRWIVDHDGPEIPWEQEPEALKREYRHMMRAALVAAQEAAPQAETDRALEIAHELANVHTFTMADGEAIARAALSLAAPVPSSGVDEEALAEVIRRLRFNDAGCWADDIDCTESVSDHADVEPKDGEPGSEGGEKQ